MSKNNFLDRLKIEFKELNTKLFNLQEFILKNDEFHNISKTQQELLIKQEIYMSKYSDCLYLRIIDLEDN